MKFLADMGVSRRVIERLRSQGHEAIHLSELGLQRLPNGEIFRKATDEQCVVLTFDLDFGEIVALSGAAKTSVIVFRLRNTRSENVSNRLTAVLHDCSDALEAGAIVIVEDWRHRVRRLPIGGNK